MYKAFPDNLENFKRMQKLTAVIYLKFRDSLSNSFLKSFFLISSKPFDCDILKKHFNFGLKIIQSSHDL